MSQGRNFTNKNKLSSSLILVVLKQLSVSLSFRGKLWSNKWIKRTGFLSTVGICGCLFMVPVLVQKFNDDNEVGEYEKVCRNYWDDFKNKRSDLDAAFSQWKPSGEALVLHLRQSAEKLVSNRKWTASTEVLGARAALVGGVLLFNPVTLPFGTILTLGGKIFRLLSQFVSYS